MARVKSSGQSLRITQKRSLIGQKENQRRTVKALGLKRIRHSVVKEARPEIIGMINTVHHLVDVEEIAKKTKTRPKTKQTTVKPAKTTKATKTEKVAAKPVSNKTVTKKSTKEVKEKKSESKRT